MMASFHLMRRQLSARLRWLNCGQVGERGSCPLTEVTHVLRPAENACARPVRFARANERWAISADGIARGAFFRFRAEDCRAVRRFHYHATVRSSESYGTNPPGFRVVVRCREKVIRSTRSGMQLRCSVMFRGLFSRRV